MSIYDTLNAEQKKAVFHTEGPLLILAGAGSGKTRVITHRIAYLMQEKGVRPWNILAITFTNKAAGELRSRVNDIVGFGAEQIWVATFHSTCVRILRRHIDGLGYDNQFTIYDADDQKTVMKEVMKRLNLNPKEYKEKTLLNVISSAKDELIGPEEFARGAGVELRQQIYASAYAEYEKILKQSNALDFDDLLVKTVRLFREKPEILRSYQERFRYILVDEYQDTNTAQFELVRLLALANRNLCVVGDDDQSIYKFRGANINNILDFEKVFNETAVIKLEQNYRSTQNILNAANALIRNNQERKDKALWTGQGEGSRIHFCQFDTAFEEAEYIAFDILGRVRKGEAEYGHCAVLYRTNAQSRLLEERFVREGIPYDLVGGVNFYSRREIKDMLAYLKTINNGQDDLALKRIINVPRRGIGTTTIGRVEAYALEKGISFFSALREAERIPGVGKSVGKLKAFVSMMEAFHTKSALYGVRKLLENILETVNYAEYLKETDEEEAKDRMENVHELITKAAAYEEANPGASLAAFLEEVALVADIDKLEGAGDRALLMTLHSAKGLEFPVVYLSGLEENVFPGYLSVISTDYTALEEERRLAYVGITRAMRELTLTAAHMRMNRGETQYNAVSRFVREIPEELLDSYPFPKLKGGVGYGEDFQEKSPVRSRPKATVRAKGTALEHKPFIARGLQGSGLTKGAPIGESPDYREGDRVTHVKYGQGTVTSIEAGPRDYQVTVEFDGAGPKIMYAAFAKLKKV